VAKTQKNRKKTASKSASDKAIYVARHRRRLKREGLRRTEVAVRPRDVPVIKSLASKLQAGGPEAERLRDAASVNPGVSKAKTGAELYEMFRKLAPLADEVDLTHRDNIYRPVVEFD
jgi:hypothetical protein